MRKSLFIIFTLQVICTIVLSSGQTQRVEVRDTDGNPVLTGYSYYIVPAVGVMRGGGGVTLAPGKDQPCPYVVAQENYENNKGLPLNFVAAFNFNAYVYESTDLNVKFSGVHVSPCIQTAVWRVEGLGQDRFVSSHAIVGSPGKETIRNWFKIEKFEKDYKMVYCPSTSVCKECNPYCADIGSTIDKNGRRILVLNNVPLKIKFIKA